MAIDPNTFVDASEKSASVTDEQIDRKIERLLTETANLKRFEPPESRPLGARPGIFARRRKTLLGGTAALLSRLYLPPWQVAISWPVRTGQIRAAGRLYYAFYAAASLLWMAASF